MPRPKAAVADAQPALVDALPELLAAHRAYRQAAEVERNLGVELTVEKKHLYGLQSPLAILRSHQAQATTEESVGAYQVTLETRERAVHQHIARMEALQEEKRKANDRMLQERERWWSRKERAVAAKRNYRKARHISENDPSALERYRAKMLMTTSYKILENLVGPDEARAVLTDDQREWLRG